MSDDAPVPKMMRPNDLFTAAYYGDVKKLQELLHVEPVEEDPPLDEEFDPAAPADEEAEEAQRDRDSRRAANEAELKKRLCATGRIVTRLSPVNVQHYGIGMLVSEADMRCTVQFKASKKATAEGTPLHWAVLGREHDAVELLLKAGADPAAKVTELGVTAEDIIAKNDLKETAKAFARGVAARATKVDGEQAVRDTLVKEIARRAQARQDHADEERRKAEEEARLEAEAAAAEEAAAAAEAAEAEADDE